MFFFFYTAMFLLILLWFKLNVALATLCYRGMYISDVIAVRPVEDVHCLCSRHERTLKSRVLLKRFVEILLFFSVSVDQVSQSFLPLGSSKLLLPPTSMFHYQTEVLIVHSSRKIHLKNKKRKP